jgi:hypothetical protein
VALALAACWACKPSSTAPSGITAKDHGFFPVATGDHALDCAACHTDSSTFMAYSCVGCHAHERAGTDLVHNSVANYTYASPSCYRCHPAPTRQPFDHQGIAGSCALCHDVGASFAALPLAGFTHMATNGADCGGCHTTGSWATTAVPSGLIRDPARDVRVTGLIPSYAGTSIIALRARTQALPMGMDHKTGALDATTLGNCGGCHATARSGGFYPGVLHASLASQALAQPTTCADCHTASVPVGFVGPLATLPARNPASGEMKHDAVDWSNGAPTATAVVVADCAACHASPSGTAVAPWATGRSGTGIPVFHGSLATAQLAQPATCLDCHANGRPGAVLTSGTAALPARVTFDHGTQAALGECARCHAASAAAGWASWAGGRYHLARAPTPSTCLPCHEGERPTSATGWVSATYKASPFDYGTNAANVTHGDGQDCAGCHAGPGTGAWGGTQNWAGGQFDHGPATVAATTCITCHMSQRPDLEPGTTAAAVAALLGFDHARNGSGDCYGCHQATVTAGRYVNYVNPSTQALPGGDWAGGAAYPGATLVSALDAVVTLSEITLTRSGSLVTGSSTTTATLYGAMTHVSLAIPAAMSPGPAANPDLTTCWHCHTNVNGTVTSYANGKFHESLTGYAATPGGTVTPLPQPTSHCADCHAAMRPAGIVEPAASNLQPMDHAALFTAQVTIDGAIVHGAAGLDCAACHARSDTWADGAFHGKVGSAVPQDCTVCHYPLMATATADVASGTLYSMSHRSALVTVQRCDACHATALAKSTRTPVAATLWQIGAYHASVTTQPTACLDCHSLSVPATPTQSSAVYVLASGGTATNGVQWMSHAATGVVGVDCAACHAADARASGAAWSRGTAFHAIVASPDGCQACHGLTNGNGSVVGIGNNLPFGLTDSSTPTTASNDATTGIPPGTPDQIIHTDLNVSGQDCGFCHTQVGPSTAAGVQGKEWAQASFHTSFSASAPLVTNGTTGRCSDCHMNVKPGASFTAEDHSAFTDVSGSQDCSACHTWPGTGTPSAPNWLGGGAAPQLIAIGGFTIPDPPSSPPSTQDVFVLPHPDTALATCATCHTGGVGGKGAIGYDHASPFAMASCDACHEAGSDLVGTVWNGVTSQSAGAGDTRPITLASVPATYKGSTTIETTPNHFYLDTGGAQVDCINCHVMPTGISVATSGPEYRSAWAFKHPPESQSQNFCWQCHPSGPPD